MELSGARARLAAEKKMLTQEASFQQQLSRASHHSARLLEAKEKELIQIQLHFRNSLRALQDTHAADLTRLGAETERLKSQLLEAEQVAIAKAGQFFLEKYKDAINESDVEADVAALTAAAAEAQAFKVQTETLAAEKRVLLIQLADAQQAAVSIRDELTQRVQTLAGDLARAELSHQLQQREREDALAEMTGRVIALESDARGKEAQSAVMQDALVGEITVLRREGVLKDDLNAKMTLTLSAMQRMLDKTAAEGNEARQRLGAVQELCRANGIDPAAAAPQGVGGDAAGKKRPAGAAGRSGGCDGAQTTTAAVSGGEQAAAEQLLKLQGTIAMLELRGRQLEDDLEASRRMSLSASSIQRLDIVKSVGTQCDLGGPPHSAAPLAAAPAAAAASSNLCYAKKGPEAAMSDRKINAALRVRLSHLFADLQIAETRLRGLLPPQLRSRGLAAISLSSGDTASTTAPVLRFESASSVMRPELAPIPLLSRDDVQHQNQWFLDEMRSRETELARVQECIEQEEVRRLANKTSTGDINSNSNDLRNAADGDSPGGVSVSPTDAAAGHEVTMSAAAFASTAGAQAAFRVILPIHGTMMPTPSSARVNAMTLRDMLKPSMMKFDTAAASTLESGVARVAQPEAPATLLVSPRNAGGAATGSVIRPKRPSSARALSSTAATGDVGLLDVLRNSVAKAADPATYFAVGRGQAAAPSASGRRSSVGHFSSMRPPGQDFGGQPNVSLTSYVTKR
jgi:hypothetical protein